jgi:hypothetical protein
MERETALADFDRARAEWEAAFARVPDTALDYLKPNDDYALGGLQVHVNWVLRNYLSLLHAIVAAQFAEIQPEVDRAAEREALDGANRGLQGAERQQALDSMSELHGQVCVTIEALPEGDWARKAPVIYGPGQEALPTSPDDVLGWLRDHYREHVVQSADLIEEWRASTAAG